MLWARTVFRAVCGFVLQSLRCRDRACRPFLLYATGQYNETVFRGVDYVLAQAARFNIKVIIALTTYSENTDGVGNVSIPGFCTLVLHVPFECARLPCDTLVTASCAGKPNPQQWSLTKFIPVE